MDIDNAELNSSTATTQSQGDNSTKVATTAYVDTAASGFTQGSVIFADSSGYLAENNSKFFWDNTNYRIGINKTSPLGAFHAVGEGTGDNYLYLDHYYTATGYGYDLAFRRARGSASSPTIVTGGDVLSSIDSYGYDGSNFIQGSSIQTLIYSEVPGTNDMPTQMQISLTADGASSPSNVMRLRHDGTTARVGINTIQPFGTLDLGVEERARKLILYSPFNDDRFNGWGFASNEFIYQCNATTTDHVFYVGTGASSKTELMRISGTGEVIVESTLQAKGDSTFGYSSGVTGGVKLVNSGTYGKPAVQGLTSAGGIEVLYLNPGGGAINIGTAAGPSAALSVYTGGAGTGIGLLTGSTSNYTAIQIGRASLEGTMGVASGAGIYALDAAAGDIIIRTESSSSSLLLTCGSGYSTIYVANAAVTVKGTLTVSGYDAFIGTTTAATGTTGKVLIFGDNGGNPTMGTNTAGIFAKDVSGTVEMFAIDEANNATQLSSHNPETGEWRFYSKNVKTGRVVEVNMEAFFKHYDKVNGTNFFNETMESI